MNQPEPNAGEPVSTFVSRGGLKMAHALREFAFDVTDLWAADFGCSTGGFTDCLLQAGAAKVVSVDTGYGVLAWKLRQDPRVIVMERSNALHAAMPQAVTQREGGSGVDLVTIDASWTPQRLALPAALKWLRPSGRIISLIKPHYELDANEKGLLHGGVLDDTVAESVARRTAERVTAIGVRLLALTPSPIRGSHKSKPGTGNMEWLGLFAPTASSD